MSDIGATMQSKKKLPLKDWVAFKLWVLLFLWAIIAINALIQAKSYPQSGGLTVLQILATIESI